ncbi:PHA/PHB synthase family protein [Mycobacterium syngnathidarum]
MTQADPPTRREDRALAGGFESVLTAGAMNTLRGRVPTGELGQIVAALARHPRPALNRIARAAREIGSIAQGVDDRPGALDRRFSDVAWQDNALLQRIALGYLAGSAAVEDIVADAEVDWRTKERARVFVDNVLAAAAPSNNPLLNPASLKRAIDTAGTSWIRGLRSLTGDMANRPRIPSAVDGSGYRLGDNLAATPGKVIRRGRLYELIQYAPISESVDAVPVLCVASPVNKYYLLDLGPKESVTRVLLERGRQAFTVSWVNPDQSHQDVGLDDYIAAIVEMLETVAEVCGTDQVHLTGFCGGGQLAFTTAGYLAATGRQELLASLTVAIAVIDFERGGTIGAMLDRRLADRSIAIATRRGYFDGRDTAEMFAWIRPNDGIWVNVVNNYLLGLPLTTFDLVYWSTDQTNLALAFGTQLVDITLTNAWAKPGGVRVLGESLDPGQITVDTYILGASTDHICPWQDCYRTRALLGGQSTFVLAKGGHAAVIARGPGSPRASYRTAESTANDPYDWQAESTEYTGTWWEHWERWIAKRTPGTRPAPTMLGSLTHPPVGDAPGQYVRTTLI